MNAFNAQSTTEEVAASCAAQIAGKTILITGVSPNSLSAPFATIIAAHAPSVLILCNREPSKIANVVDEIGAVSPKTTCHVVELDLGSLAQVRQAVHDIEDLDVGIDVIVNGAGVMAPPYEKTVDGIETQFGVNFVGHFLLTNLLLPKMLKRGVPLRVVNVSSNGYRFGPVRFEDYNFDDGRTYDRWLGYAQSKTANLLFSISLAHKLGEKNVTSTSLHPGVITSTCLSRHLAWEDFNELGPMDRNMGHASYWNQQLAMKTPSQGVATHVYAAFHPDLEAQELNESYLTDSSPVKVEHVHCWGRDPIDAEMLWKLGENLVGEKFYY